MTHLQNNTKKCNQCGLVKPFDCFSKDNSRKLGIQPYCKVCMSQYYINNKDRILINRNQYYLDNKEEILELQKEHYINNILPKIQKNKEYVWEFKLKNPCKCGESHPACLDFDHIDPAIKFHNVSYLVKQRFSLEIIQKEIDKCEVICANCHLERHSKDIIYGIGKKRLHVRNLKFESECMICEHKGIASLVFHHRKPEEKLFKISACNKKEYTMEILIEEIAKCDIYCENHHRILHHNLRQKEQQK